VLHTRRLVAGDGCPGRRGWRILALSVNVPRMQRDVAPIVADVC